MKPTEYDLRQLRIQDNRLMKFKEAQFIANGRDGSVGFFIWILIISLSFGTLLIPWLLWEWYMKLLRMTLIFLTQIKLWFMKLPYTKLLIVLIIIFISLFILSNIFK